MRAPCLAPPSSGCYGSPFGVLLLSPNHLPCRAYEGIVQSVKQKIANRAPEWAREYVSRRRAVVSGRLVLASVVISAVFGGCGFFDVENTPDPLWGVWSGPYPTTLSAGADSAIWLFCESRVYRFHALNAKGETLYREQGYFTDDEITVVLMDAPGEPSVTSEYVPYEITGDRLLLVVRQGAFTYRRIRDAEFAEEHRDTYEIARPSGTQP